MAEGLTAKGAVSTPERKKSNLVRAERRRQQRRDWLTELARIQSRQARRIDDEDRRQRHRRNEDLLLEIHAMLLSDEFAQFYKRQTGRDVREFVRRVVISPDEFLCTGLGGSQLKWTRAQVEAVLSIGA